jgi:hypothetical protein
MSSHQLLSEPIKRLLSTGFKSVKTFSGDIATPIGDTKFLSGARVLTDVLTVTENHPDVLIRPFSPTFEASSWIDTPPKSLQAITGVNIFVTPSRGTNITRVFLMLILT